MPETIMAPSKKKEFLIVEVIKPGYRLKSPSGSIIVRNAEVVVMEVRNMGRRS